MKKVILFLAIALVLIPAIAQTQPQQGAPFFGTFDIYWADKGTRAGIGFNCGYQNIPAAARTKISYDVRIFSVEISGIDTTYSLKWDSTGTAIAGVDATGNEPLGPNGELNIFYSPTSTCIPGQIYLIAVQLTNDSGQCRINQFALPDSKSNWLGITTPAIESLLYPTLFSNELTISSEEDISLTVIDMSGKQIISQPILAGTSNVPTTEIPNGSYVAYLTSSSGTKVVKISK